MNLILNNGIDCLNIIIEYLTIKEFCLFCQITKQLKNLFYFQLKWKKICLNKWNINENQLKLEYIYDGMILYPYIWPICHSFVIPDNNSLSLNQNHNQHRNQHHNDNRKGIKQYEIQFNGIVGENNRSVRTKEYFPPLNKPLNNTNMLISFAKYLCGCKKTFINDEEEYSRFFSIPYYDTLYNRYNIELRQVAYYEVKITSNSMTSLSEEDCIAIGLSNESFSLVKYMPGWDEDSYGYHSDDGGIFHGKGTQLSIYGPKYGLNDIVGCGLRYDTNEIFYTLNGTYLGVAFENVSGILYPTVGIDANVTLNFNFGNEAFLFSLHHLVKYF